MPAPQHLSLVPLFEELRGDVVVVRPFRPEDAPLLHEAIAESRDFMRPWLPWADAQQTVEESLDWINQARAKWITRTDILVAMFDAADNGRFVGGIDLHPRDWAVPFFELGYWMRATAARRGYMTEAVQLLTRFALDVLGAQRVQIRCDVRNTPSANVARRAGYVLEGVRRNDSLDTEGNVASMLIFSRVPGDTS
jgi:RimJ/RimL family protein N-acetyltransferase